MYCPECGYKINDENAIFCPECGTRVAEIVQNTETKDYIYAYGIIFTDIKRLANKLNAKEHVINDMIESYIVLKNQYGISYRLVDVSCYVSDTKTAQLSNNSTISDYMEVLTDAYNHQTDKQTLQYLFIIGGHDIIPMPQINHYCKDVSDKTIDTDILYAFPYGRNMLPLLENVSIFRHEQAFLVGRLPIGEDTSFNDFCNYLKRASDNAGGIPLTTAYGQCDPNWKNVSATVAEELITNNKLINLDNKLSGEYYFQRLILSPEITTENVEQVFNTQAHLYYFNLHGSNALESCGYFGAKIRTKYTYPVLLPQHLASCQQNNIVACEACYGARFINLDKQHSMLLSALYNKTLLFLGSSRIAWGNVDPTTITSYTPVMPAYADTMAIGFMNSLLKGYSAGQAFFIARNMVLCQDEECCPNTIATIVEFNLFGDPSLMAVTPEMVGLSQKAVDKSSCQINHKQYDFQMEPINLENDKKSGSILQLVRRAVDNNIAHMQSEVSRHLYEQYGIEPRQPSSIFKVKLGNNIKELRFIYDILPDSDIKMVYTVKTTEDGKIKSIITTK